MDKTEYSMIYGEAVSRWEEERKALGVVQPYTAARAAQKARLLLPWIGSEIVDEIDPLDIGAAMGSPGQTGGRFGKGLSSATLRSVHLAGTQAVQWAKRNGFCEGNAFSRTQRPRANYRKSNYLTLADSSLLLESLERCRLGHESLMEVEKASFCLAAMIALATGMRRGEIFALEWGMCDMAGLQIGVARAVKGDGCIGLPKSNAGVRRIAIGESLARVLDDARRWQSAIGIPRSWANGDFVVCNAAGKMASMNTFEHWWRSWADDHGWVGLRFHELRHTHATLMLSGGTDVKTLQVRLGHSSADITMSCYAHAIPLADKAPAQALDAALFG